MRLDASLRLEIRAPFVFSVEYDGTNRSVDRRFNVVCNKESSADEVSLVLSLMSSGAGIEMEFFPSDEQYFKSPSGREWNIRPLAGMVLRAEHANAEYDPLSKTRKIVVKCAPVVSRWSDSCALFAADESLSDILGDVLEDFRSRGFDVDQDCFGDEIFDDEAFGELLYKPTEETELWNCACGTEEEAEPEIPEEAENGECENPEHSG